MLFFYPYRDALSNCRFNEKEIGYQYVNVEPTTVSLYNLILSGLFDFTKRECESLVKVGLLSVSAVQGLMKSIIRVILIHVFLIRFANATLFFVTYVEGGVLSTYFLIDCFLYVAFLHHTQIPNKTSDVQLK